MTDEEIWAVWDEVIGVNTGIDPVPFARAIEAARATAEQSAPYGVVYEWDCGPGVVHRDFGFCTYNGRYPDRTVTVYAAHFEANTLKVKK